MTTTAKLGGTFLNYGFSWELAGGIAPVQREFVMSTHRADAIFARGRTQITGKPISETRTREERAQTGPLMLQIGEHEFAGLYALEVHAVNDTLSSVLVADCRWLLKRKLTLREYNLRKPTGQTRYVQSAETPVQVNRPVADYVYKRVSLKDLSSVWTAREVVEDILKELLGSNYRIAGNLTLSVDVETLTVDDDGDAALARILALMPGAGVYVDRKGVLVVYNTLDKSEARVVEKIKQSGRKWWGDDITLVDRALVRPAQVGVFFEQEIELRFDYTEGAAAATTAQRGREERKIENVFPVVHPSVTLNGEEYARGSWLQADDWITATQAQLVTDGDNSAEFVLSQALFRRHAPTGFSIPRAAIARYLVGTQAPVLDQIWNAIQTHWRKTFRIAPRYMDKIKSIRAIRVAIRDQETGTRGRAEVFADYMVRPSRRGLMKRANEGTKAGYNFSSYAAQLQSKSPAPAEVTVVDPQVGIFRFDFVLDPFGEAVTIIPGNLSTDGEDSIPSWDMGSQEGLEKAYVHWNTRTVRLSSTYNVAVILTAVMATPTNVSRYHLETIGPAEAESVLPAGTEIGECFGPDWGFKIGAGIDTARWAWNDAKAPGVDSAVWDGLDLPNEQLINPEILKNVAKARAAMVYELLLDRHEGVMRISMDGSIEPTGSLRSVIHTLDQNGVASTTLVAPPLTIPPDIWSLMPDSTRRLLQRRVQL